MAKMHVKDKQIPGKAPKKYRNMNTTRRQIKVFYPPYYPAVALNCTRFPTFHVSLSCLYPGLFVEIIDAIAKELDLEIVPLLDYSFGRTPYTNIPLMEAQKMVENGSIDVIALGFQKTEVWTRLLRSKNAGQMEEMFSFFQTYEHSVWLAFILMWMLQWIFCLFFQQLELRLGWRNRASVGDTAWQILRLQLLQSDKIPVRSTFGKVSIYLYSLLQCTILMGLFSSFILASIIKPKPELENPIQDLINKVSTGQSYMVTNDPDAWFFEKINTSKEEIYIQLRHALAINPLRVVSDREEALRLVANDNAFLFQQVDEWSFFRAMESCDVVALEKYMRPEEAHLIFRKNYSLLPEINKAIESLKIKLTGLSWKYFQHALSFNKCPPQKGYKQLQLTPYIGLCFVSLIILSLASFILLAEIVVAYFQKKINQKLKYQCSLIGNCF